VNVTAQEILRGLVEKELQIECTRIRQRHHEAGQSAAGASHDHVSEVRPVGLRLLARKCLPD
jgi:hypothetical protein